MFDGGDEVKSSQVNESGKKKRMKLVKDLSIFRRKDLTYFIHCIDASLIHRFILTMRYSHG